MKIQFMVEDNSYYNSDMEYKIIESYYPEEYPQHGYDIYQVETDNISNIHIVDCNMIEYEAEQTIKFKNGDETIYYISVWKSAEKMR